MMVAELMMMPDEGRQRGGDQADRPLLVVGPPDGVLELLDRAVVDDGLVRFDGVWLHERVLHALPRRHPGRVVAPGIVGVVVHGHSGKASAHPKWGSRTETPGTGLVCALTAPRRRPDGPPLASLAWFEWALAPGGS